jgi:hypothetical protein
MFKSLLLVLGQYCLVLHTFTEFVVGPGPDFVRSGFAGDNRVCVNGRAELCLGTTVIPDAAVLRQWMDYPLQALARGQDPMGGWSPCRSSVVRWGTDRHESYFKAADDNQFDLVYWPLAVSQDFDYDAAIATMLDLEIVWVSGVIANLLEGHRKLRPSVFREASASLMKFLATEQQFMQAMLDSTRLEHGRFMAYFSQERRHVSLPTVLPFPESLIIAEMYDEFGEDFGALSTPSSSCW